ncbi:hypothetical protein [Flagellimonas halotolerans]|uniref:Addiction module component n=1 Tax=Flagellimonas halotolerans TaxID=3112164 RepID=A0ABU6IMY6_9FLAO|nr:MULTISPECIES: hypothetical protein [unclassified Allomuricauda]MBA4743933.1 hypothetical protein [Allomuricauda sp.]MEC3964603.1 hypothetical protein [Muricauda sp. SYSU M86414]MEC4264472.1 hypothetical protein [Muricauda sp. SYSU M84420]
MNIQAEKIELVKMLLNTNDPKIIQSIKRIFKKEGSTDFWDELTTEQQAEINQGISEIENGDVVDFDSFMAKHR